MEVDFRRPGLAGELSNLQRRVFHFRGTRVLGMESVLVAAKFSDTSQQQFVATTLHGFEAMKYGKKEPWWEDQLLHWKGHAMEREGQEYADFVTEAYDEMFAQNADAAFALRSSGTEPLKHSIGGTDPTRTVLTRAEFCGHLERCRLHLLSSEFMEW